MNQDYTDERQPLDTKEMLETAFFANLNKAGKNISAPKEEIQEARDQHVVAEYNTESLLLELFEARDSLIETFSKVGMGTNSKPILDSINKIGSCIRKVGGEVGDFDPFVHISGLKSPNLKKNAQRVIENTIDSYSLGQVGEAEVLKDEKTISIAFHGQKDNINYRANGEVIPLKTWVGNECIEYVWSPSEGKMSVKALSDDGKWIDKSGNYKISWELIENEMKEPEVTKVEGKEVKTAEIKEEVKSLTRNNIDEDISDDFTVEEKI